MVEANEQIAKIYWTISEAALAIGENASALRFWEPRFSWIRIKKNRKGNRQYTSDNLRDLIHVHFLIKWLGMTEKGIKQAHDHGYFNSLLEYADNQKQLLIESGKIDAEAN